MNITLVLSFDGGNAKNTACYGYTIGMWQGREAITVAEGNGYCFDEKQTSNIAEWSGLMYGLSTVYQIVKSRDYQNISRLIIHGDSQLVLKQLDDEYSVTQPHLKFYYDRCKSIVSKIEQSGVDVVLRWDYRGTNSKADSLTHLARKNMGIK